MVHSAFDRFWASTAARWTSFGHCRGRRTGWDAHDAHHSVPGSAVEYALGEPVFDARLTVSRMGLITEVFRRAPGVVRSVHPTHSVAVWGSRADAIVAGHELADTPCGRLTPYAKLLDYDGKILLAGCRRTP